jgi:threonine dehydratase
MIKLDNVYEAKRVLEGVSVITPLIDHSALMTFELYNKLENMQLTGSFKIRGAYNKIVHLSDEQKECGIICASAGNHAQGVAFSAKSLGIKATIVMPKYAPLAKIEATRSYGVEIILYGDNFDEAYHYAQTIANDRQLTFIEPYNDDEVIAGQATIALEISQQLKDIDIVVVPIGGGGLASGIAYTIKQLSPTTMVIGVQAASASSMYESIRNHKIIRTDSAETIADGIAVKCVGSVTYEHCRDYLDEVVLVSEQQINQAIIFAMEKLHILVEGAGAVGLAALLAGKINTTNKRIVNIISGGNIDITLFANLIDAGLRYSSRRITIGTIIPDKPGHLTCLLQLLSDHQVNVIDIKHDRYHHNISPKTCYVELTIDTFNNAHIQEILKALENNNYQFRIK